MLAEYCHLYIWDKEVELQKNTVQYSKIKEKCSSSILTMGETATAKIIKPKGQYKMGKKCVEKTKYITK